MRHTKLVLSALAVAAVGCGVSACSPFTATSAQSPATPVSTAPVGTASGSTAAMPAVPGSAAGSGSAASPGSATGVSTGPGRYLLAQMPAGTVRIEPGVNGRLRARVDVSGLTPGSSHLVSIEGPLGHPVWFPVLTANSAGQADATLTSVDSVAFLRPLSRFVIRLGATTADPLAAEPIAESAVLPQRPGPGAVFSFHAVTVSTSGASLGQPGGQATVTYNASAQTLTVTVTATGLTPGPHAAHIHLGSCVNQGPVKYMLADFTADANGAILGQTRTVTGVTSVPAPGNWYLNLHQGGMNQILASGVPTLNFRPMLCTDLTTFATPQNTPAAATPSPSMTATGSPSMTPAGSPSMPSMPPTSAPATSTPASTPTSSPTVTINAQPTHY